MIKKKIYIIVKTCLFCQWNYINTLNMKTGTRIDNLKLPSNVKEKKAGLTPISLCPSLSVYAGWSGWWQCSQSSKESACFWVQTPPSQPGSLSAHSHTLINKINISFEESSGNVSSPLFN